MDTTQQTATTATATDDPQTGEQIGVFTFEREADPLGHAGVWIDGACYGDDLRSCWRRAASLTQAFGVEFYTLLITGDFLRLRGPFASISEPGCYAATSVHNTATLRRVTRGFDRARGMTPRESAESEAQP